MLCGAYADELFPNQGVRFKDRSFEIGFNATSGFFNNTITAQKFLQERVVIDLDNLDGDLNIRTGIGVTPFYMNIRGKEGGGWGLSLNVNAYGSFGFSEKLLSFSEADKDKSDSGFAVFADATMDFIFKIKHFKVKLRPSVFLTAVYTQPEIVYTFDTTDILKLNMTYDARVYTALDINDIDNINFGLNSLSATPGVDISIGIEYPLSRAIGLFKRLALFDFDVGIDILHIPIVASTMNHYIRMTGNFSLEGNTVEDFFDIDTEGLSPSFSYGEEEILIERPFRWILWADWRFFGSNFFTLSPHIGLSINPLFLQPFSMEYGLKAKLDLANFIVITVGTRYEDRLWKTGAGLTFNLKIVELNIGADFSSAEFFNVLNVGGVGIHAGFRIGF